ncbi:MAG: hypothetical protein WDM81_12930 [Rhizomicrobium sp.]
MTASREIHLVRRPDGMPKDSDFALVERVLPDPADGQVEVRNLYLSIDPATRPRLTRGQDLDTVVGGFALGRVVGSRSPNLKEGDIVRGAYGYRDRYVADARHLAKVEADPALPLTVYLHVLGGAGFVAYGGLIEIGRMKSGRAGLRLHGRRLGRLAGVADRQAQGLQRDRQHRRRRQGGVAQGSRPRCRHQL